MSAEDHPVEFTPSADYTATEGPRDIALVCLGDEFVSGYGDGKALGWVSRVVGRTPLHDADVTTYNLGVRDESSAQVMARWRTECAPRWAGRNERRLVVGVGAHDLTQGISTARSRLNLANILDEAATTGVGSFVVGPAPTLDAEANGRLEVLADAQADVCARRSVPYVDCFHPLRDHDQWQTDLAAGDGVHPGQAGYGLIAWLVLHAGWQDWLRLPR